MTENTSVTFDQLGLAEPVLRAVQAVGYETPSPIQLESIPPLLAGRDVLGQAQTGTGKTAAFSLPLLSNLDADNPQTQLLVLTPTRELALQVAEAMQSYARNLKGFHVLPIYGGQSMGLQLKQLRRGAQVVVGTPGRIQDHLRRGTLDLANLKAAVLDEADEMLRMGFVEEVEDILAQTPAGRQVALFSATMPPPIRKIADRYLDDPVVVKIKAKTSTVDTINQRYCQISGISKLDALTRILEVEAFDAMIVFVRTKTATMELTEKLEARGYAAAALNGDLSQAQREATVERLKKGALDIVVATDVAARGLDVDRMSHVVNYDIPYDTETYVHRIGRTGRAGRKGEAILFVSPRERRMLFAIEKATRQKIAPLSPPNREQIAEHRLQRFKSKVAAVLADEDLSFYENVVAELLEEATVEPARVAAALAFMLENEQPISPPPESEFRTERKPSVDFSRQRPGQGRGRRLGGDMQRYRIEVGRTHGVQVKNIVGAIANEAGVESRNIGQISLYDDYSTVDLPEGMPKEIFQHLRKVWVCGQQMRISRMAARRPEQRQARRR